jgi:signal transduction histidine kinase
MNLFIFVSALVNGIAAIATGSLVYMKKKNHLVNQTFAVFCFAIAFWAFGSFWPLVSDNPELSLTSFRILHVGAFFLAVANFHFVCAILGIAKEQKNLIRIGYVISVLLLPLIGTRFFIEGVIPKGEFAFWAKPGVLYHFWIVIWLAFFARTFHLLGYFYKKSEGIKKQQIKYIYLGEIVSFSTLVMNFLPAYNISVPIYFNILLAGQIAAFTYAILRYRYLDVQLSLLGIVKKVAALVISLGLGLGISYVVFFREEQASVLMLFPIVSLATYFSLSGFFNSRSFYRTLGMKHIDDLTKAVDNFYEKKLFYSNLPELLSSIHEIFIKDLDISTAEVVILNSENQKNFGMLTDYFQKSDDEYLSLKELFPEGQEAEFNKILKLGMLCFPLRDAKNKILGFFFLGHKPRQHTYTHKELQVLKAAAAHISLSLKILNYSADLRREVTRKTKQLKKQAKKLQSSYKQLKKLDREKDTFFSMTSHDLRTPLTIIKGYDDFLLSEKFGKLNSKQKNFVQRTKKSTDDMLWLVNSLLDISKLDAGRMEFNFEKVDLIPAVEEIVEDFKVKCSEKSIQLSLENRGKLKPKINTDMDKLKRVIVNLLGNAFKFTPEKGKISMRIKKCESNPKLLRFEVEDTGVGIPKDSRQLIFEEFKQVKNPQQKGGTGLGLSIVKKIVEKLGGKIWVESEVDKGSNFIFTIPLESKIKKNSKSSPSDQK